MRSIMEKSLTIMPMPVRIMRRLLESIILRFWLVLSLNIILQRKHKWELLALFRMILRFFRLIQKIRFSVWKIEESGQHWDFFHVSTIRGMIVTF